MGARAGSRHTGQQRASSMENLVLAAISFSDATRQLLDINAIMTLRE